MNYNVSRDNSTDEELVELYQNSNNDALLVLLSRYIDIIDKKINYCVKSNSLSENDDMKQEALIVFINSIRTYNVKKGSKFSTYSSKCIDNMIKNQAKSLKTKKAVLLSNSISFENIDILNDHAYEHSNPEQLYINKEKYDKLQCKIDLILSDLEKNVLYLYLEGNDYQEISKQLNHPTKSIDNALQRVRKKLKS